MEATFDADAWRSLLLIHRRFDTSSEGIQALLDELEVR
jgi:hypothetical protein